MPISASRDLSKKAESRLSHCRLGDAAITALTSDIQPSNIFHWLEGLTVGLPKRP